jgi:hypothetical protein
MLIGDALIDFCPLTVTAISDYSTVYNIAGNLVIPARNATPAEGFFRPSGYQDGHVITSRLDFGYPGRLKRINRLTALIDNIATKLTCTIYYRTDDATAWTEAVATANDRRVSVDLTDVTCYVLQLKVAIAETTTNTLDYAIEAISVTYTTDD